MQSIISMSSSVEQDIDSMKKYLNKRGVANLNQPTKWLRKMRKQRIYGFRCKASRCSRTSCGDVVKTIQAVLASNFVSFLLILVFSSPVVPSSRWSSRISSTFNSWASFKLMTRSCNLFNISLWQSPLASCSRSWMWPFIKMKNNLVQRLRTAHPAKERLMQSRSGSKRGWKLILLRSWGRSWRWWWTAYRFASSNPWGCKLCKYRTAMTAKKTSRAALNGLTGSAGLVWLFTTFALSLFWWIITQCSSKCFIKLE